MNAALAKRLRAYLKQGGKLLATGHQRHYSILYDNAVHTIGKAKLIGDLHSIRAQWHRGNLPGKGRAPGVQEDINRISAIWRDCRTRFGQNGPYLFGAFSIADAMYAPLVSRFQTYSIKVDPVIRAYMDAIFDHPAFVEWYKAAMENMQIVPHDEVDETPIGAFR